MIVLGVLIIGLIFICLLNEVLANGSVPTFVSSFWVFTFFYVLSFPVKYILIVGFDVPYQAPVKPDDYMLVMALLLSFCFWGMVYVARTPLKLNSPFYISNFINPNVANTFSVWPFLLISGWAFYMLLSETNFVFGRAFEGNEQNEARFGSGHFFILYTLYFFSMYAYLFMVVRNNSIGFVGQMFLGSCFVLALVEVIALATRRPLFLYVYMLLLFFVVYRRDYRAWILLAVFPVVSSFAAPVGQFIRYNLAAAIYKGASFNLDLQFALVSVGSTFEGVEHLANYLNKVNPYQLVLGVDYGISWAYKSGLALVPRAFWSSKPEIYGSVAQQYFLYPEMYAYGPATSTFPSGIWVDFIFGFGVFAAIIICFLLARLFAIIDSDLFNHFDSKPYLTVMFSYIYVNMFNVVRAGTSVLTTVLMLLAVVGIIQTINMLKITSVKR